MIRFLLKLLLGRISGIQAYRITHKHDRKKDMMIIVCEGHVDSDRAQGAVDILSGKAHARRFAKKKVKGGPEMIPLERAGG